MGLAARGRVDEARQALAELHALGVAVPAETLAGYNRLKDIIAVAEPIVAARIAASEHRDADAVTLLEQAVAAEDALAYNEPADWFFPARHLLGAQLLLMDRPAAAEKVYTEDLKRNPSNGWSLFGLMLAAQGPGQDPGGGALGKRAAARPGNTPTCGCRALPSGTQGPTRPAASASTSPQARGKRVVNFLVRSTKLVFTERTAASCSSWVDRKCSYASMLAATILSR